MAHGHDMKGEVDKGLSFLGTTETDWQAHMVFSLCLVSRGCKSTGGMLDTVDACSLLYRLQMEGEDKDKDRWRELVQATLPHTVDHVTVFNDVHFLMASLGGQGGRRLPAPAGRAPRPGPVSSAPSSLSPFPTAT
ncbi:unnamed protein product [Arctogadus glacialis]